MGVPTECLLEPHLVPQELYCPVCTDLVAPRSGLQTPCGHIFCASCITAALRVSGQCPADRKPLIDADLRSVRDVNPLVYRLLGRTSVRCPHHAKGCAWRGELSELPTHAGACRREEVPCASCSRRVPREEMGAHRFSCSIQHCEECAEKDAELREYRQELVLCRAQLADCRAHLEELQAGGEDTLSRWDEPGLTLTQIAEDISRNLRRKPPQLDTNLVLLRIRSGFDEWQKGLLVALQDPPDELLCVLTTALAAKDWFSERQKTSLRKMLLKTFRAHRKLTEVHAVKGKAVV